MTGLVGLPLGQALRLCPGCKTEAALPPRRMDKTGTWRVVRAQEKGGTVLLTVSPFQDTLPEEA